jgi:hypothetical protein
MFCLELQDRENITSLIDYLITNSSHASIYIEVEPALILNKLNCGLSKGTAAVPTRYSALGCYSETAQRPAHNIFIPPSGTARSRAVSVAMAEPCTSSLAF